MIKYFKERKGFTAFSSHERGFTLIELLVVVAVLGILAGGILIVLNISGTIEKANITKAKRFAGSLENGLAISQVGKWSLNETLGAVIFNDSSGYGNDGSCATCPVVLDNEDVCGLGFGGCVEFVTDGQFILLGNPTVLTDIASGFTISAWAYPKVADGPDYVIWNKDDAPGIHMDSLGKFWQFCYSSSSCAGISKSKISLDTWTFLTFTFDGATYKGFVNGVEEVSGDATSPFAPGVEWRIGMDDAGSRTFKGYIDEVAIYNEPLTISQIQDLYAQGLLKRSIAHK